MSKHTTGKMDYLSGAVYICDSRILLADRRKPETSPAERDSNLKRAVDCWNMLDGINALLGIDLYQLLEKAREVTPEGETILLSHINALLDGQ